MVSIPHSSDKTVKIGIYDPDFGQFLSHIVQTKLKDKLFLAVNVYGFLSHIVQTKQYILELVEFAVTCFYPTQFRQNFSYSTPMLPRTLSFYPTQFRQNHHLFPNARDVYIKFLSHIVQTKQSQFISVLSIIFLFLSHIVQTKHIIRFISILLCFHVSIPHSSDKTSNGENSRTEEDTWFLSHIVQTKPY